MFILSQLEKVTLQASLIPTSNESSPFNLMLAYGINFFRSKVRHKKGIGSEKGFVIGYVIDLNNKHNPCYHIWFTFFLILAK